MTKALVFQSALVGPSRLLPGIHGLRGIAALAVVFFHTTHIAKLAVPSPFSFIPQDFGKGVHLFFIVSAFSLLHSTVPTLNRPNWATEYCVKRFFRIAPLFYLVLFGMLLWQGLKAETLIGNLVTLLLNITFTFGLSPWTGVHVWAGWSIGIEILFYALFPLLLLTVRTSRGTLFLVIFSILVAIASRITLQDHFAHTTALYHYNWSYFSFAPNFCFFTLGMYAYHIAQEPSLQGATINRNLIVLTTLLLLVLLFLPKLTGWRPDIILWGCAFAALAVWQASWPSRWCANSFFEYLGERSYSIYLLHPIIIYILTPSLQALYGMIVPTFGAYAFFVCTALLMVPLLLLAESTYRLLEIPCIRLGRKLSARNQKSVIENSFAAASAEARKS